MTSDAAIDTEAVSVFIVRDAAAMIISAGDEITQVLGLLALPIGLERHKSQRRGSNPLCDLGKVACRRKHFADMEPLGRLERPACVLLGRRSAW